MEDILQLIEIAKKKGQRSIQLVNQNFRKKETSKDNLLYEGIINGEFFSDDDAAKKMFRSSPGNRNYRNARAKLKQKLLNHLYFLDYEKDIYTLYDKQEYDCLHTLHQVKILVKENANNIAAKLLPHLIRTAKEFELADIAAEGLKLLRDEYAMRGKATPFHETFEELKEYRKFHQAIEECYDHFYDTVVFINKSVSAQNRVLDRVPETIQFIEDKAKEFNSNTLEILAYQLRILYNKLNWNFKDTVNLCTQLEKKYLQKPNEEVTVNLNKNSVAFTKLYAYHFLKDVNNGKLYANKKLNLFKNGSDDWFNFIEYYFLLLMAGEEYDEASKVFRKVRTNKNYTLLEELDKQRWNIYRAYLIFVNNSKLLRWGFDIQSFIKTTPKYPKDYVGYNVSTLAIQFLFLLREGYIDEIKKTVKEIQKYSSTHLDKRHNYRNSIFIRLLSIVVEKEFNYEVVKEKGNTYYKKLKSTQIPGDLENDIEVIPFEVMWNYILDILKTNKLYVHYRFYNVKLV